MIKKIFLTIDVEVDKDENWRVSKNFTFNSIIELISPRFISLINRYNIKPILFISPEVLDDNASVEIIKRLPYEVELGAHLHTQFIRYKHSEYIKLAGKFANEVQTDLSTVEEQKLISQLRLKFIDKFSLSPMSFRPGRYSIRPQTYNFLIQNGFKVCSSITPFIKWTFDNSVVDHSQNNIDQIRHTNFNGEISEIPITIKKGLLSFNFNNNLLFRLDNKLSYYMPYFFGKKWLRPSYGNSKIYRSIINSNYNELVIIFHSNELILGGSPYSRNEIELDNLYSRLELICNLAIHNKYIFSKFND